MKKSWKRSKTRIENVVKSVKHDVKNVKLKWLLKQVSISLSISLSFSFLLERKIVNWRFWVLRRFFFFFFFFFGYHSIFNYHCYWFFNFFIQIVAAELAKLEERRKEREAKREALRLQELDAEKELEARRAARLKARNETSVVPTDLLSPRTTGSALTSPRDSSASTDGSRSINVQFHRECFFFFEKKRKNINWESENTINKQRVGFDKSQSFELSQELEAIRLRVRLRAFARKNDLINDSDAEWKFYAINTTTSGTCVKLLVSFVSNSFCFFALVCRCDRMLRWW